MEPKPTRRRYASEQKESAVRVVFALREELGSENATVQRVGDQLGCGVESVRLWVKQAEIDRGLYPGTSSAEAAENKRLRQESRKLKRGERDIEAGPTEGDHIQIAVHQRPFTVVAGPSRMSPLFMVPCAAALLVLAVGCRSDSPDAGQATSANEIAAYVLLGDDRSLFFPVSMAEPGTESEPGGMLPGLRAVFQSRTGLGTKDFKSSFAAM